MVQERYSVFATFEIHGKNINKYVNWPLWKNWNIHGISSTFFQPLCDNRPLKKFMECFRNNFIYKNTDSNKFFHFPESLKLIKIIKNVLNNKSFNIKFLKQMYHQKNNLTLFNSNLI